MWKTGCLFENTKAQLLDSTTDKTASLPYPLKPKVKPRHCLHVWSKYPRLPWEKRPFIYISLSILIVWATHKYIWCVWINSTSSCSFIKFHQCTNDTHTHALLWTWQLTCKSCSGKQVNERWSVIESLCFCTELFILINNKTILFFRSNQTPGHCLWVQACVHNREKCPRKMHVSALPGESRTFTSSVFSMCSELIWHFLFTQQSQLHFIFA